MPIKINFKRTHRYNVSAKDLSVIRILLLDGTCVEYTVTTTTTGKDALEYISQRLDIEDTSIFGLKYEDWSGEHKWLSLNKSIKKQLDKNARQPAISLGVLLFIDNPQFITDNQLRRFFYLQLRQDVATGALPVTLKLGIKLSAYSLQADFGDFVDVETTLNNWRARFSPIEGTVCGAFDLSTTDYLEDILWGYLHLQGVSQDNAVWYFLDEIRHIPQYGVRTFQGMTCRNEPAELGVSRNGITVTALDAGHQPTVGLKWEHIKDLTYSKKTFTIQMLKKNKSVQFLFDDAENARYLWQFCIQMHSSYIDYWTKVKSSPQQPAIHISEPPDILRGTEPRYTNSDSPLLNGRYQNGGSSCSLSPIESRQMSGGAANRKELKDLRNQTQFRGNNLDPVGNPEHKGSSQSELARQSFKIDPDLVRGVYSDKPMHGLESPIGKNPLDSLPPMTVLTSIQEANGDSETGTLVGQWSLRSAADTLDSQMLNRGCVTCLPGREWLKAAGWFQPRSGVINGRIEDVLSQLNSDIAKTSPKLDAHEEKHAKNREHHCHHHRHHQNSKSNANRLHRHHSERHREAVKQSGHQESKPRASSSNPTGFGPSESRRVLMDRIPASTSSLNSSDSSSEHGLACSFSSSSSSCCTEPEKRHKRRITHPKDKLACSPSTSSTSSINSPLDSDSEEEEEEGKKFSSGLTAALWSAAQNISFKGNTKAGTFNTRQTVSGQGKDTTGGGRKPWAISGGNGLRPLLAGLNQHHYRPQVEMKRHQVIADVARQNHEAPVTTDTNLNKPIGQGKKFLGNKKFQEFHKWLTEAKHRLPAVLTHSVPGRGVTLQISPPVQHQRLSGNLQMDQNSESITPKLQGQQDNASMRRNQLLILSTEQPGRLARSSSEACAHQLPTILRSCSADKDHHSGFMTNPTLFTPTGLQQGDGKSFTLIDRFGDNPPIHLFPASPSQTLYSQSGPSTPPDSTKNQWDLSSESINKGNEKDLPSSGKSVSFKCQQLACNAQEPQEQPCLKRQGAIRVAPSRRLVPSPLNLAATNRLAVTPPRTIVTKPSDLDVVYSQDPSSRMSYLNNSNAARVNLMQQNFLGDKETVTDGHSSAPPTTPSNRTHFVWDEFQLSGERKPEQQGANNYPNSVFAEWQQKAIANEAPPITLSHLLGKTPDSAQSPVVQNDQTNQQENDETQQVLTCSITTTSSSDHSSSRRPPSNGPLHLLTNSDIHQLLNLTNIRETELAHRLLAEYRQALLQQQNLHTNSVSTPNLTASQELQMFSSSTAAEDIEDVDVDLTDEMEVKEGRTDQPGEPSSSHPEVKNSNAAVTSTKQRKSKLPARQDGKVRQARNALESPDYVNAAAFHVQSGCGERPLSMVSSTEIDSNGTFRVLSSTDTQPGSVIETGQSVGSGEASRLDWPSQDMNWSTGMKQHPYRTSYMEHTDVQRTTPPDLCPEFGNSFANNRPAREQRRLLNGEYENVKTLAERQMLSKGDLETTQPDDREPSPNNIHDKSGGGKLTEPDDDQSGRKRCHGSLSTLAYSPTSLEGEADQSQSSYMHSSTTSATTSLLSASVSDSTPDLQNPTSDHILMKSKTFEGKSSFAVEQLKYSKQSSPPLVNVACQTRKPNHHLGGRDKDKECSCSCHETPTLIKSNSLRMTHSNSKESPPFSTIHNTSSNIQRASSFDPPPKECFKHHSRPAISNIRRHRNLSSRKFNKASCLSYSDEDINQISDQMNDEEHTSITTSPFTTSSNSSMSSHSYSTSSLDLTVEEMQGHRFPCCQQVNSKHHYVSRSQARVPHSWRRGSYEPGSLQAYLKTSDRHNVGQVIHHGLHRKGNSDQPVSVFTKILSPSGRTMECIHCTMCGSKLQLREHLHHSTKNYHRHHNRHHRSQRQLPSSHTGKEIKTYERHSPHLVKTDVSHKHPLQEQHPRHYQRSGVMKTHSSAHIKVGGRKFNELSDPLVTDQMSKHQRQVKSQQRECPAKPPRPKDLSLVTRQPSTVSRIKMSPSMMIKSPSAERAGPTNEATVARSSPVDIDQSKYGLRSLHASPDLIKPQKSNNIRADAAEDQEPDSYQKLTRSRQADSFQLHSTLPERRQIFVAGKRQEATTSQLQSRPSSIQYNASASVTQSPSSPNMVYTSSMVFKPSSKPLGRTSDRATPINFRNFLVKNSNADSHIGDTTIVRSGSLEPNELLTGRVHQRTQRNIKTELSRSPRPMSGIFQK